MHGLSPRTAARLLVALPLALAGLLLAGCGDAYPDDITYGLRTDLLVLKVPKEKQPERVDAPGQLAAAFAHLRADGGETLDPAQVKPGSGADLADRAYRDEVVERFSAVARGAASATGAALTVTARKNSAYDNMVPNRVMSDRFAEHLRTLGVEVAQESPDERMGSTDMGNVMQVLPGIHPYIKIAPEGTPGHSVAFRDAAATNDAHDAALRAAKAMALLTIDLLRDRALLRQAKDEFAEQRRAGVVRGRAQAVGKT
jgi:hypothetical protein